MASFLRVYSGVVFVAGLVQAVAGIDSSSWRKPQVTLSFTDRVNLATQALNRSISVVNTIESARATVYNQMAEIDVLTNQTKHENQLDGYIYATSKAMNSRQNLCIAFSPSLRTLGHAAIRAHAAYKTAYFLGLANETWTQARLYTISEANLTSGSSTGKNFSLQSTCQGSTLVGGTFNSSNPTDGVITGFASTYFLTVSALLAEATSDPVYLDAALDSANFILAHLCPEFLVQTQISASQDDSCALNSTTNSFNTGLMIEGLAVLSSITSNATMQAILNRIITATISNMDWQTADGIIIQGSQKLGDKYIMGGLTAAYMRNVISPDLRGYVHDFIGVQFNAVVDLAAENGNSVYGGAWTGPPYDTFSQPNQTLAISALLSAILLDGVGKDRFQQLPLHLRLDHLNHLPLPPARPFFTNINPKPAR
ncbi:hypothetical protein B0H13DRAFT_2655699 [Mycena leptocephala]|nr:hypothetical protein B0H13DRAFT_2655699 [Mycena leptocephala]